MERVGRGIDRSVVRKDDLHGERSPAKEVRATNEARLHATSLVVRREDEAEDVPLAARRPAAPEPPTPTAPRPAAALVTVAVPLALGTLARFLAVPAALHYGAHGKVDATHAVDFGDLDPDFVADAHDVLDPAHAFGGELADSYQTLLARKVLDEGADAHDPRDLALVDLADLGLLGEALDHRPRSLAALGLRAGDTNRAVVLQLDRGAGLR